MHWRLADRLAAETLRTALTKRWDEQKNAQNMRNERAEACTMPGRQRAAPAFGVRSVPPQYATLDARHWICLGVALVILTKSSGIFFIMITI
jgi:hypothetical protein